MTLKDKIMKLQTYKMFVGENTVYVERDDILKLLEQEPRWIPCSEKLPEKSGDYLVTAYYDLLGKVTVREVRRDFFSILSKKWIYEGDEVTAWMPLPEPYREVEE